MHACLRLAAGSDTRFDVDATGLSRGKETAGEVLCGFTAREGSANRLEDCREGGNGLFVLRLEMLEDDSIV